jgi:hypothetical protein
MKFNLTFLEILIFLLLYILLYLWLQFGRRLRRWWRDYFRQRRGKLEVSGVLGANG